MVAGLARVGTLEVNVVLICLISFWLEALEAAVSWGLPARRVKLTVSALDERLYQIRGIGLAGAPAEG